MSVAPDARVEHSHPPQSCNAAKDESIVNFLGEEMRFEALDGRLKCDALTDVG